MVHDFVALKKAMKSVADQMDHCVLMPGKSKVMKLEHVGTQINVSFENKSYSFPKDDVKILDLDLVSAEMMAIYALDSIVAQLDLGGNITKIKVGIDEGIGQGAWASREL